jgi:hypothetical protein
LSASFLPKLSPAYALELYLQGFALVSKLFSPIAVRPQVLHHPRQKWIPQKTTSLPKEATPGYFFPNGIYCFVTVMSKSHITQHPPTINNPDPQLGLDRIHTPQQRCDSRQPTHNHSQSLNDTHDLSGSAMNEGNLYGRLAGWNNGKNGPEKVPCPYRRIPVYCIRAARAIDEFEKAFDKEAGN